MERPVSVDKNRIRGPSVAQLAPLRVFGTAVLGCFVLGVSLQGMALAPEEFARGDTTSKSVGGQVQSSEGRRGAGPASPSEPEPDTASKIFAVIPEVRPVEQAIRYPRLAGRHELTKNPKRRKILETVHANPGIHFRELGRVTEIPDGGLQHHLRVLRYHGLIIIVHHHNRTLVYAAGTRAVARLSPTHDRATILQEVSRRSGIRHNELMELLRLKRTTLDYHVHALEISKEIRIERNGRERIYYATSGRNASEGAADRAIGRELSSSCRESITPLPAVATGVALATRDDTPHDATAQSRVPCGQGMRGTDAKHGVPQGPPTTSPNENSGL